MPVAARSKVLLVEDSKFMRLVSERTLTKAGYEVSTAEDGEQALRVANEKLPDVILLDMLIPKISGPDVLKALKENPSTRHIPVVVLSSLSQRIEEELLQQGAVAYLEKGQLGFDKNSDQLVNAVKKALDCVPPQTPAR